MPVDLTAVFKALADPTRGQVRDQLHRRNGQTLTELCGGLSMARQSASQHIAVLEAANLISTTWHGREKLHHLNPVPLFEVQARWIDKFEEPRLRALRAVRLSAEERTMAEKPSYVYVTYIAATPERVWDALTDPDVTARCWGHSNVSDWRPRSEWRHVRTDGSGVADIVGTVLDARRPERLEITFPGDNDPEGRPSRVVFDIEGHGEIVRLTMRQYDIATDADLEAVSGGWPAVLANLKSLLETGSTLPQAPWDIDAARA